MITQKGEQSQVLDIFFAFRNFVLQ